MDRDLTIWAAGFFDGEGCINIGRQITKRVRAGGRLYVHTGYQLQTIVAQRNRRPLEVLVGLFGGSITSVRIHGSVYWYYRLSGPKASAQLSRLIPFLVLKQEQAELAVRFQEHYDRTRKEHRGAGRSPEEWSILEGFYEQSKAFNVRNKQKDYTEEKVDGVSGSLLQ